MDVHIERERDQGALATLDVIKELELAVEARPEWFQPGVIEIAESVREQAIVRQRAFEDSLDANGVRRGKQPFMDTPVAWSPGSLGYTVTTRAVQFPDYATGRAIFRAMTDEGLATAKEYLFTRRWDAAMNPAQPMPTGGGLRFLVPSVGLNFSVTVLNSQGKREQVVGIRNGGSRHVAMNEGLVVSDEYVLDGVNRGMQEELEIGPNSGDHRDTRVKVLGVGATFCDIYGFDFGIYGRIDYDGTLEDLVERHRLAPDRRETQGFESVPLTAAAASRELRFDQNVKRIEWQQLVFALTAGDSGIEILPQQRSWAYLADLKQGTEFRSPAELVAGPALTDPFGIERRAV